MYKKYLAEFVGTFALCFVVLSAVAFTGTLPVPVPVIAGLTLALFVYTIGSVSGCHINPAVTLGILSVRKISLKDALLYIGAQLAAAICALLIARVFMIETSTVQAAFDIRVFFAEALGAFFFCFGIASVVYGKAKEQMSGIVIGWSLLLGVLISSFAGSAGILNPAVALALSAVSITYLLAPIAGSLAAFWTYKFIVDGK